MHFQRLQVVCTLNNVYGVLLPSAFYELLPYINMDVLDFGYPSPCIGNMSSRLITSALWPLLTMLILFILICVQAVTAAWMTRLDAETDVTDSLSSSSSSIELSPVSGISALYASFSRRCPILSASWPTILDRTLYMVLIVTYSLLPSVSRNIFAARQCESFVYDARDGRSELHAYLSADPDIRCSDDDSAYKSLQVLITCVVAHFAHAIASQSLLNSPFN